MGTPHGDEVFPAPGSWTKRAACIGAGTRVFFPTANGDLRQQHERALAICEVCEVRDECASYALANPMVVGIWGGLTEAQRRRIRKGTIQWRE